MLSTDELKDPIFDPIAEFTPEERAHGAMVPASTVMSNLRKKNTQPALHSKSRRLTGPYRDKLTMASMKADMAAWWRTGDTYAEIAESVSDKYGLVGDQRISNNAVHWHIKRMLDYWRSKAMSRIDERQAMLLGRLDQLESICLEAYFRSVEGKTTTHQNKQVTRARSKEREKQLINKELEKRERDTVKMSPDNQLVADKLPPNFADTGDMELADLMVETEEKIQETSRHEDSLAGDPKWVALMFNINKERAKILGLHNVQNQLDPNQEAAKLSEEDRMLRINTILQTAKERQQKKINMLADPSPMGGFKEGDDPTEAVIELEIPEEVTEIELPQEPEITGGWGFDEADLHDEWD